MELREEIAAPYETYTGKVLNEIQCETYNRIQRDINRWIMAGRDVPEHLLNESHRTFNIMANLEVGR